MPVDVQPVRDNHPALLRQAWATWSLAIPREAPIAQRIAMKTAFFSGAATLLGMVLRSDDEDQARVVADLLVECSEFQAVLERSGSSVS